MQKGFDDPVWGNRNNPNAELNVERILNHWRENKWSVIHVQHSSLLIDSPLRPGQVGFEFKNEVKPIKNEPIFVKKVNSAFIGTNLEKYLNDNGITSLVFVGLTTDHCVSTSVRMAGNLGFKVKLISDATATFDKMGIDGNIWSANDLHNSHLASLNNEFCEILDTNEIIKKGV
jgi:nicotinamidase-related amidase